MSFASVDHLILGYLGRALSLEFSAVQLYSTQARLVASWGLAEPANKLKSEANEEMEHVDRIIARMLALGVAPNASQLRPAFVGKSLVEILNYDLAFELELVKLYHDATSYCAKIGDQESRLFFETLLREEQAHSQELGQWIAQLEQPVSNQGATF
jgi:bacterioferritin